MTSSAPEWDLVPFEVGCARCGQDLRGLTDPACPACNLEFEWTDVVPLDELQCLQCGYQLRGLQEPRCPECGERFTWPEILEEVSRRRQPLFEYRWRRTPLRSFARTWLLALRPRSFWRRIDIHQPPAVGALLLMVVAGSIATWLILSMGLGIRSWLAVASNTPVPLRIYLPSDLVIRIGRVLAYLPGCDFAKTYMLWVAFGLASLLVFRQSMRKYKVRTVHVVRVWAYSHSFIVPTVAIMFAAAGLVDLLITGDLVREICNVLPVVLFGFASWSVRQGYADYLHMPHAAAVAIVSQIVAILAMLGILTIMGDVSYVGMLVREALELVRIW